MKEQVSEALELFKTDKSSEAFEKLEEAVSTLEEAEVEVAKGEEMEKKKEEDGKDEMAKMKEEMKKWADMYISAENVQKLLEDLKNWFKTDMVKLQEDLEKTINELPQPSKQFVKTTWDDEKEGTWDSMFPG